MNANFYNFVYYGLKYIRQNRLKCRMIFIHIPLVNKVSNIVKLANLFDIKLGVYIKRKVGRVV